MADNKNNSTGTNSTQEYINDINSIIRANQRLYQSYKNLTSQYNNFSSAQRGARASLNRADRIGGVAASGVRRFIRDRGGAVPRSPMGSSHLSNFRNISSSANGVIRGLINSVSNSSIMSRGGLRSIAGGIANITRSASGRASQAMQSLFGPANIKNIKHVASGISVVVHTIEQMARVGRQGYSENIKLKNSLTQLGKGADFAYKYASQLNEELGTPLSKSINNISSLASQLKGSGGFSSGAAGLATRAYDLSTRVGLMYHTDPQEVFENMQRAIINGENTLLSYNVQVSDEVLAGWLAATKGINMYAVELSNGAKQAYRWMMIQEQLADVSNYSGDLTNSTFAQELEMLNKLEEAGIKLRALFVPLFSWLIDQANAFTDVLLEGVNNIRATLGLEKINIESEGIVDRNEDLLNNIDKQNAAYRKQGELLKKNANQKLPFDEWYSLETMQQLNKDLEDMASGELPGLGGETDGLNNLDGGAPGLNKESLRDQLKNLSSVDIEAKIKTSDTDGLFDLWDNFNFIQKGMYGAEMAIEFFQRGEISKGIEALLFGAVGSFTGITAIKELAQGDYLGAIANGAQTALFLFGGWKGKIAAGTMELVQVGLQTLGLSEDMANLSSVVAGIGILIGGWRGALVAALAVLVPIGAKLGAIAGQWGNMQLNKALGSEGVWGSIQSFDARTAANIEFGKGTPEAEAYYYEVMRSKFGDNAVIPEYASGGIALSPHIAEIGHGREAVIPLDSPEGQQFAHDLATMINPPNTSGSMTSRGETNLVVPVQYFIGDTAAYNLFLKRIRNSLLDIERSEGGAFDGTY